MAEWQSLPDSEKQRIITSGTEEEKRQHHPTVCKMSGNSLKSLDLQMLGLYDCNKPASGLSQGAKWGIFGGVMAVVVLVTIALYVVAFKTAKKDNASRHR